MKLHTLFRTACLGLGLSLGALLLSGCAHQAEEVETARPAASYLTKIDALERSARVSDVHYRLHLDLPEQNTPFTGQAEIQFNLSDASKALTLDFVDGSVESVQVNGKAVAVQHNGFYITLPASALSTGLQTVKINYSHPYRRDGSGLHWSQDAEDGEVYLFTQFEDYHFNKVFPGFDQPDLKATYTLSATAPAHWQVISATRETSVENISETRKRWIFPETALFSTYVFSLHAGPYKVWQDNDFRIPLRLFSRQSYQEYVDVEEWFKVTRQGLDFFDNYFGYPYPFEKFDQLLVPDFVFGAMENVGAVTFTENLQPRREKTRADRQRMAVVVMHELAHQWFGDLVTMTWWDDIWLNESFADLMGNFATAEATEYKEAMQSFSTSRKSWGYSEDQWITTHPIVQDIANTEMVMASIDGITYAKGAATLIQLKHRIGEATFQRAIAEHFQRFAWKNAQLSDLLATLSEVSEQDLSGWSQAWLEQSGVNALKAEFSCSNNKISHFSVIQTPANVSGALRQHKLDALLISASGQKQLIDINVDGPTSNQPAALGLACPAFVLLNASDFTFARILFDQTSVDYLKKHILEFTDPIQQGLIWRALWESVTDGELAATEFLDLALSFLPTQTNTSLIGTINANVDTAYSYLVLRTFVRDVTDQQRKQYRNKLEAMAWQGYQTDNPALKRTWFRQWVNYLHSKSQLANAQTLLAQNALSNDDAWTLVGSLVREQAPTASTWLASLSKQDPAGKIRRLEAEVQAPDIALKQQWLEEVVNPNTTYAFTDLRGILFNLFPLEQHDLNLALQDDIIATLLAMTGKQEPALQSVLASAILPRQCSTEGQAQYLHIADTEGLAKSVQKVVLKNSQAEQRCVAVQRKLD
ncbi:aminopeptidase N [Simiduia curdlanivorans]|uniref:Aminopeptidase N n=1 Tax=Simiduia curdlanivorans TaxID=1492769 RepID=A0ABV8V655_9GAMM|nr:aminopeptidase N [Simiduia curdlanivorans]MDN3638712.1 aminopeptidase N [Simiduia curdlanivorans]